MITRVEIDGFKSFTDFEVDLQPLSVIAGVNGVGKSNLFDALLHVGRLVGRDSALDGGTLREAFESDRGSLGDLFSLYPDGSRAQRMRFAIEFYLPQTIEDEFSEKATLDLQRLRYELVVAISGTGDLELKHERLKGVPKKGDRFLAQYPMASLPKKRVNSSKTLLDTVDGVVRFRQDGRQGKTRRAFQVAKTRRTALSSLSTVEFKHAFATRRALTGIRYLQLQPNQLRLPSAFAASTELQPSGYGLAAAMARIAKKAPERLQNISTDVSRIVPGIRSVTVVPDSKREEWSVEIVDSDGRELPAKLVSDGTLRLLALATIVHDPDFSGIVILEEPENGIYAGRIEELLDVLEAYPDQTEAGFGHRQLLTNTHSVPLVRAVRQRRSLDSLMFAYLKRAVRKDRPSHNATTVAPVFDEGAQPRLFSQDEISRQQVAFHEMQRMLASPGDPEAL